MLCTRLLSATRPLLFAAILLAGPLAMAAPFPHFFSSDPAHDALLNDLFRRQARADQTSTSLWQPGYPASGLGTVTLWRDMEIDMLLWHDYGPTNYPNSNRPANIAGYIASTPIDRFGYVYSAGDEPTPTTVGGGTYFGAGWPFPFYGQSNGLSVGWEWNGDTTEGWSTVNATSQGVAGGEWTIDATQADPQIVSPVIAVQAVHAPLINLELQYSQIDAAATAGEKRFQLFWQTSEEPFFSEDKSVFSDSFPLLPVPEMGTATIRRLWLPMHLHAKWHGKVITRLRLDPLVTSEARAVTFRLNALRLDYDTRHANNNSVFVRGVGRKFFWDRDSAFLAQQLPRMRQAMQCLLINFDSSRTRGIDHGWLSGHTGRGWLPGDPPSQRVGEGIGNNYFDILPMSPHDIVADVEYYRALQTMATIEAYLATHPELDSPRPTINGPDGQSTSTYAETAGTLRARIEPTRQAIHALYWNPATQRYGGWRDADGVLHDYGYTHFNLEALEAGIPDADAARAVLDWLDGRRIVAGDTSTGADIYHFGFAARISTLRNSLDYVWPWSGYTLAFGNQVQDGGAVLFTTFYDVRGRLRYGDTAGAWAVWQRMLEHHRKVLDCGGTGTDFYRKYYREHPEEGVLQGGGPPGGLGLDVEFVENQMTPAAWALSWLGAEATRPNVLTIKPTLPPGMSRIGTQHIVWDGNDMTVSAEPHVIDLAGSLVTRPGNTYLEFIFQGPYSAQAELWRNGARSTSGVTRKGKQLVVQTAPCADRFEVRDPNASQHWAALR